MALDFSVDLDALDALQRSLAAVREDLAAGPAGRAAHQESLNPRVDLAASTVRANSELSAPFAYGLLHEAPPLGRAHEDLARTVHVLVRDLQELIETLRADAAVSAGRYRDADASVFGAVSRAGGELGAGAGGDGAGGGGGVLAAGGGAHGDGRPACGGGPAPGAGVASASPSAPSSESFTAVDPSATGASASTHSAPTPTTEAQ
jgi:hypothetical protein